MGAYAVTRGVTRKCTMSDYWWQHFFDDDYAYVWQGILTPERTSADVAGLDRLLQNFGVKRVVDLGCGTGRITVPLAELGYFVVGLDFASVMLAHAATAAAAKTKGHRVLLCRGDMRYLPMRDAFDAVICLFNSFGYFPSASDDQQVMHEVYIALRPKGAFILETVHRGGELTKLSSASTSDLSTGVKLNVRRLFDATTSRMVERVEWAGPGRSGTKQ